MLLSSPSVNGDSDQYIQLLKVGVDSSGACTTSRLATWGNYDLAAGNDTVDTLAVPLQLKVVGGAKYCLATYVLTASAPVSCGTTTAKASPPTW